MAAEAQAGHRHVNPWVTWAGTLWWAATPPCPTPPHPWLSTCVDGADGVFVGLQEGHQGHHDPHGAGEGLLGAVAGVHRLAGLAEHKDVLAMHAPGVHGHVLLLLARQHRVVAGGLRGGLQLPLLARPHLLLQVQGHARQLRAQLAEVLADLLHAAGPGRLPAPLLGAPRRGPAVLGARQVFVGAGVHEHGPLLARPCGPHGGQRGRGAPGRGPEPAPAPAPSCPAAPGPPRALPAAHPAPCPAPGPAWGCRPAPRAAHPPGPGPRRAPRRLSPPARPRPSPGRPRAAPGPSRQLRA